MSGHELLEMLREHFKPKRPNRKFELVKKLVDMKMPSDSTLEAHVEVFHGLIKDINLEGMRIDDEVYSVVFALSLPDEYSMVLTLAKMQDKKFPE